MLVAVELKARRCPRYHSDDYLDISSMAGVTHGVIPRLEHISLLFVWVCWLRGTKFPCPSCVLCVQRLEPWVLKMSGFLL